jgi:hypothetical protein
VGDPKECKWFFMLSRGTSADEWFGPYARAEACRLAGEAFVGSSVVGSASGGVRLRRFTKA